MVCLRAKADRPEILETVGQIGVVGSMHGGVRSVGGVAPVGLAEELVELNRTATDATKSVTQRQRLRQPGDYNASVTLLTGRDSRHQ